MKTNPPNIANGTVKTIINGWLKTGDLGYLDDDGYLFILDRKKALIIRGGENISCLEVENALDKHPDIIESCVSGIEDEKFGEIVGAYVYARNPIDKEDLMLFLKDKLGNIKYDHKDTPQKEAIMLHEDGGALGLAELCKVMSLSLIHI